MTELIVVLRNFAKAPKNNKCHICTVRVEEYSFFVSKIAIQTAASTIPNVITDQLKRKIIMIQKLNVLYNKSCILCHAV